MENEYNEIEVNGVVYIPKDLAAEARSFAEEDGLRYCIVRTYSAGVFAGLVRSRDNKEVELVNARRLWYWSGAASLSQLSLEGVKNPDECKFPRAVPMVILTETIEILPCTQVARDSIDSVPIWEQ